MGSISGTSNANSVIGTKRGNAPQNCFFLDSGATDSNATAKSETELKALAADLGEAFAEDSGSINNGYPVLAWQNAEKEVSPDLVINTVEKFQTFASAVNGGDSYEGKLIVLTENLDLDGKDWTPIGNSSQKFQGTFDGQYHTISGLNVSAAGYAGLFGNLGSNGVVKNLAVEGVVKSTGNNAGGLVAYNSGTIKNCLSNVEVTSTGNMTGYYTAGIAGYNYGSISSCVNLGDITGTTALGGIAGISVGPIENSYNLGDVTCSSGNHVGGVVGQMRSMGSATASLTNCYGAGSVTGSASNLGALIGQHQAGDVTNCHYLSTAAAKGVGSGSATATPVSSLSEITDLGDAFETVDGRPTLVWEENIDKSR